MSPNTMLPQFGYQTQAHAFDSSPFRICPVEASATTALESSSINVWRHTEIEPLFSSAIFVAWPAAIFTIGYFKIADPFRRLNWHSNFALLVFFHACKTHPLKALCALALHHRRSKPLCSEIQTPTFNPPPAVRSHQREMPSSSPVSRRTKPAFRKPFRAD